MSMNDRYEWNMLRYFFFRFKNNNKKRIIVNIYLENNHSGKELSICLYIFEAPCDS